MKRPQPGFEFELATKKDLVKKGYKTGHMVSFISFLYMVLAND